ncbi:hypothetical protein CLU96_1287 [Chryseobacterium sp. 52]|uniref:YobI family P-loop NTPase n=1 Tax=Chryseobacterium sp. 52 TaxID=2035213 RepID=UPI000C185112|nr:hypothetical protein [Chryseobacterium sp. 52]PIF44343.1 hypothetical protein CLU96_1287 [Chryseobacterium sp. 52]
MKKLLNKVKQKIVWLETLLTDFYLNILSEAIFFLGRRKIRVLVNKNENPDNFEDLTPYISKEEEKNYNLQTYLQSLKWGVLNENVKNIAISGSFGTGKSTILNLFKKNNPEFRTLDINLGKFEEKNKQTEVDIETSIVQQILYFEKKKNLKDSRFERITYDNLIFIKIIFFIFWAFSILYLFFDKIYEKVYFINETEVSTYVYIMKFTFLLGVFFIFQKLFKQFFKLKVSKISFSDAEFVPKDKDISIINKHVDELIYFFEKTKTQIVFIEDIDRFEDAVEVFIKLRELNIIINNSKDIVQKVTFVYAVKDELFSKNNEKTKFFDLIIPIIPVVDYSNSNTQLLKRLKEKFIDKRLLVEDIIYDVSPYINDMRNLINIVNEFKTYYKIKSNEDKDVSGTSLFALIVMKNLYPLDFKYLQNKSGIIYKIFEQKHQFSDELSNDLKNRIHYLEKGNKEILNESQNSIKDLRKLYLYEILLESRSATVYYVDKIQTTLENLATSELFEKMVDMDEIYYSYLGRHLIKFSDIEKKVCDNIKYRERKKFIEDKINNKVSINESGIREIKRSISNINNSSLFQLFQNSDRKKIDSYFTNIITSANSQIDLEDDIARESKIEEINDNYDLLKMLIRSNYVNENYSNYISLFYPESITQKDNNLKIRIIQEDNTEFNEMIDELKNFISELGINNFKKESVLNFYIFSYLLSNYKTDDLINNKLEELINTLSSGRDKPIAFINQYIDFSKLYGKTNDFIRRFSLWDGFWDLIYLRDEFDLKKKKDVTDRIITYTTIEIIYSLNKNKNLTKFVNDYDDFLINNFERNTHSEIINKLKDLDVKFNKISYKTFIVEILLEILEHNLYEININNVNLFLDKLNNIQINNLDFTKSNYSYLLRSDITYLKKNIENNINEYVEEVLLKLENNIEEENSTVEKLINDVIIKEENIMALIGKLNFRIKDISVINNSKFWNQIFSLNKVESNWKNVLLYYKNTNYIIDNLLVGFLNISDNFNTLSQGCINDPLEENTIFNSEIIDRFNISLVNSDISNNAFNVLIVSMTLNFDDISVINNVSRINKLIEYNLINVNSKNLSVLSEVNVKYLCEKNEYDLKQNYATLDLSIDIWGKIIASKINTSLKMEILNYLTENEMYEASSLSFLKDVIESLKVLKFNNYSEYFVDAVLLSKLPIEDKIFLLNIEKDNIDTINIKEYLKNLGKPFSLILLGNDIEVINTNQNHQFLTNLKEYGFVANIYFKDDDKLIVGRSVEKSVNRN